MLNRSMKKPKEKEQEVDLKAEKISLRWMKKLIAKLI